MKNKIYTLEELRCILDLLVEHEYPSTRISIAELGYGLDKLTHDPDPDVRLVAELATIRKCRGSLNELNGILDRLVNHREEYVRYATKMIIFKYRTSNETHYTIDEFENMIVSGDIFERLEVARSGYGLDTLIDDPNPCVRAEVAKHGFKVYQLLNDSKKEVKDAAYAYLVRTFEKEEESVLVMLSEHQHKHVRIEALRQIRLKINNCCDDPSTQIFTQDELDTFIHSKETDIRLLMAESGYGLEILKSDENRVVKEVAESQLKIQMG